MVEDVVLNASKPEIRLKPSSPALSDSFQSVCMVVGSFSLIIVEICRTVLTVRQQFSKNSS